MKQTLDNLVKKYDKLVRPYTLSYITTFVSGGYFALALNGLKHAEYKQASLYFTIAAGWGIVSYFFCNKEKDKTVNKD